MLFVFSSIRLALRFPTSFVQTDWLVGRHNSSKPEFLEQVPKTSGSSNRFPRPRVPRRPANSGSVASFCSLLLCFQLASSLFSACILLALRLFFACCSACVQVVFSLCLGRLQLDVSLCLVCFQLAVSYLLACFQFLFSLLLACVQLVFIMFSVCFQLVVRLFLACVSPSTSYCHW